MATAIQRSRVKQLKYARQRESERLLWIHTQDRSVIQDVNRQLKYAMEQCLKESESWITRYAMKEKISTADALKLASSADIKSLAEKAKIYVPTKDFSDIANSEMRLYNFSMRMSRHELLLRNMDLETLRAYGDVNGILSTYLGEMSLAELRRQAGILGLAVGDMEDMEALARQIANSGFQGAHFSDRIWQNQSELLKRLDEGITKSMLMGKHPTTWMREMRHNLTEAFNGSAYAMKRLAVTESARVQIASQKAAYEAGGYDWFEFIAEPSACEICRALDGKIAPVKTMMFGGNAPPIHPNCKCSTAASMGPDEEKKAKESSIIEPDLVDNAKKFNISSKVNDYFFGDDGYSKWKSELSSEDFNSLQEYTSHVYKQINSYNRKNFNWAPDGAFGSVIEEAERFMKNTLNIPPQGADESFFAYKRRVNSIIPPEYSNAISSKERAITNTRRIDEILNRYELKDSIRTYRAIEQDALPAFNQLEDLVGKSYSDPSFMSTSPSIDSKAVNKDFIMEIYVPKGVGRGAYLEEFTIVSGEYEFLLPRNSRFEITGIRREGNKNIVIMEMTP